jgi:glycosyltransferase involved in cell wall biosynthesis
MHYNQHVSVVITTRQRADLLPRALGSVLRQIHPPSEVIVVVDGKDEATEVYLKSITDPRVRAIELEHQIGGCAARNIGIQAATSDWIALLDDDDEWMPDKLQTQLKMAARSKVQYPIVACRVAAVTAAGQTFEWPKRKRAPGEHLSDYLLARNTWTQGEGLITTSMILAPRQLLLRVPFKAGLRRHQEWDWLLRAAASREVDVVVAWAVLATWNIEANRISMSNMDQWQTSFEWIVSMRRLVTPRAYASFLMVLVSAIAAREGDLSAFRMIFREARRNGHPQPIEYALMAAMWLLPQTARRKLRNFFVPQVQVA